MIIAPIDKPRILAVICLAASILVFALLASPVGQTHEAQELSVGDGIAAYSLQDYERARDIWQSLAEQGDAAAAVRLADLYQLGLGVLPDFAVAAHWLGVAADAGDADAQFELGTLYASGRGVTPDPFLAFEYILMAAEQDHGLAQYEAAKMLYLGELGAPDYVAAAVWFDRAADNLKDAASIATARNAVDTIRARLSDDDWTEVLRRLARN